MINMGGQKPKIGSNWPLNGPYLQCWDAASRLKIIKEFFLKRLTLPFDSLPTKYLTIFHHISYWNKMLNRWWKFYFHYPIYAHLNSPTDARPKSRQKWCQSFRSCPLSCSINKNLFCFTTVWKVLDRGSWSFKFPFL